MIWRRGWSLGCQTVFNLLRGSSFSVLGHQLPACHTSHVTRHTSHATRHTSPFLNELQPAGRMQQMRRRAPCPARAGRTCVAQHYRGVVRRAHDKRKFKRSMRRAKLQRAHIYTRACTHYTRLCIQSPRPLYLNSNTSGSTSAWSKASCPSPPSSRSAAAAQHQRAAASDPTTLNPP